MGVVKHWMMLLSWTETANADIYLYRERIISHCCIHTCIDNNELHRDIYPVPTTLLRTIDCQEEVSNFPRSPEH